MTNANTTIENIRNAIAARLFCGAGGLKKTKKFISPQNIAQTRFYAEKAKIRRFSYCTQRVLMAYF